MKYPVSKKGYWECPECFVIGKKVGDPWLSKQSVGRILEADLYPPSRDVITCARNAWKPMAVIIGFRKCSRRYKDTLFYMEKTTTKKQLHVLSGIGKIQPCCMSR